MQSNTDEHYLKKELYELIQKESKIFDFLQLGSLDGIWYWDLEQPEQEWMSAEFWRLFGYEPAEMQHLVSEWEDIIYQDDLLLAQHNFEAHRANPEHPYDQIVRYRHKNGSTVWVRCRGIAIRDEDEKPVRFLGCHTDVTAHKLSEAALQKLNEELEQRVGERTSELEQLLTQRKIDMEVLRNSEAKYKNLTESLEHLVYRADPDTLAATFVNSAVEKFYGFTAQEWVNDPSLWESHIHSGDRERLFAEMSQNQQSLQPSVCTYRILRRDQSVRWVEDHIVWERDLRGNLISMNGLMYDITERKQSEEALQNFNQELERRVSERTMELEQAKEEAELASKAKSDFLATMSHELRTPLNAILGFSQLLRDGTTGELTGQQVEFTTHINDSGAHLLALIEDLLDLSTVEAGMMKLHLSTVDISALLEHSLVIVEVQGRDKNIELHLEIDSALASVTLQADELRLKQVMFNLLSNAVKFTPERGDIWVKARRCTAAEGAPLEFVEVVVQDSGIGITTQDIVNLFHQFYQVENRHTKLSEGTGLGLPLARSIVEMHGGSLLAESAGEEQGSAFIFTIPM